MIHSWFIPYFNSEQATIDDILESEASLTRTIDKETHHEICLQIKGVNGYPSEEEKKHIEFALGTNVTVKRWDTYNPQYDSDLRVLVTLSDSTLALLKQHAATKDHRPHQPCEETTEGDSNAGDDSSDTRGTGPGARYTRLMYSPEEVRRGEIQA